MARLRTKSVGTKVTTEEYASLQAMAGRQRLSEWVREVLLSAATPRRADHVLLAELVALRTILLNLHFAVANGETLTADAMHRLIDRADQEKSCKAHERLAAPTPRRDHD